jgi:glycosyltransferase involved in cell wall biosynthesis
MKIALIEPYLVDYTGHYYNFVTELRRGFNEINNKDVVDIYVSEKCVFGTLFRNVLPEVKNLNEKNLFLRILEHLLFILRLYKTLKKIEKKYDLLIFTSADDWRVLLSAFNINTKKPIFMYIHNISFNAKQKLMLKYLCLGKKNYLYILSPIEIENIQPELIEIFWNKNCKLLFGAPYPLCLLQNSSFPKRKGNTFYISYLGGVRKEKGFIEYANFVLYAKQKKLDYFFIMQCDAVFGRYEPEVESILKKIKTENLRDVIFIGHNLTLKEYYEIIIKSHIIFLLYDPTRYRGSISGILLEAFSFGKPVVVREGSWLANQIKKFGGGVIVKDTSPESLKIAVEEIRFNYEKYSLEAFKAGEVLYKKYNGVELAKLIKKEVDNRELK